MVMDGDDEGNHLILDDYDGGPSSTDPWPDGTGLPAVRTMAAGAVIWVASVYGGDYAVGLIPAGGSAVEVFRDAAEALLTITSFIGAIIACVGLGMLIGNLVKRFWKPRKRKRHI